MKRKIIVILIILLILLIGIGIYIGPKIITYAVLSEEKCATLGTDDCWHALAHQTFDKKYCNNIKDNETKEHCFEHIPE